MIRRTMSSSADEATAELAAASNGRSWSTRPTMLTAEQMKGAELPIMAGAPFDEGKG